MDTAILTLALLCAFLAACLVASTLMAFGLAKAALSPLVLGAEHKVLSSRRPSPPPPLDFDDESPPLRSAPRVTVPPVAPKSLWSEVPGGVDPFKRGEGN